MRSGRQTARRLIIIRRMCTPAILFSAYSYAGSSNFEHFGQIFWRIIIIITEALVVVYVSTSTTAFHSVRIDTVPQSARCHVSDEGHVGDSAAAAAVAAAALSVV